MTQGAVGSLNFLFAFPSLALAVPQVKAEAVGAEDSDLRKPQSL